MTPQQLIGVGVRLFAVWLALLSVSYFTSIPAALESAPSVRSGYLAYVIESGYVVVALGLWLFPMVVAHRLLPRTRYGNRLSVNGHELARVGASLIGLWLFAKALPSVVWFAFRSLLFAQVGSSFSSIGPEAKLDVVVSVFELALAAFLVFKASAFASLVVPEVEGEAPAQNGL